MKKLRAVKNSTVPLIHGTPATTNVSYWRRNTLSTKKKLRNISALKQPSKVRIKHIIFYDP